MITHILAFDPSSTCTGYALAEAEPSLPMGARILVGGIIRPRRADDAHRRIAETARDAVQVYTDALELIEPQRRHTLRVAVETPGRSFGARQRQAAGLLTYGMAVGAVHGALALELHHGPCDDAEVLCIDPADWKRWRGKQASRDRCADLWPDYDPAADTADADMADACLIAAWACLRCAAAPAPGSVPPGQRKPRQRKTAKPTKKTTGALHPPIVIESDQ
ncbi:MAG: hypothetical protein EA379_02855 [Phycisphaerales bacterium]|nr:MAG: hypothetical protein EA379_02855 [Phycisphaerales bacterium]